MNESKIRELCQAAAVSVGKNAGVSPQLCFPHIYLTFQKPLAELPEELPKRDTIDTPVFRNLLTAWWAKAASEDTDGAESALRVLVQHIDQAEPTIAPAAQASATIQAAHPDDLAVDRFAAAMKAKMATSRAKGRSGWIDCRSTDLRRMMVEHIAKGDPVDVANFCMMLWSLGHSTAAATIQEPVMVAEPVGEGQAQTSAAVEVVYLRNMFGFWHVCAADTDGAIAFHASIAKGAYSDCCDTPAYCSSVRRCTSKDEKPVVNEPVAIVNDHYSRDGCNDEISAFLPVGTKLYAAPMVADPAGVAGFDFHAHLARQAAWSGATFGPGARTLGVCDHIRKELLEIEADPLDLKEWIDVVILALDGAWRCGGTPDQIIDGIVAKQSKNEGRVWPDWRTMDPNKAIEHDRSKDVAATVKAVPSEAMHVTQEPKYGIRDNRLFNRASGEFIPADEPVFIFRARDKYAARAINAYARMIDFNASHRLVVESRADDFTRFSMAYPDRMKEPDTVNFAAPLADKTDKM